MTPNDFVACTGLSLSILAILACLYAVPNLYRKGIDIESLLKNEMSQFQVKLLYLKTVNEKRMLYSTVSEHAGMHCMQSSAQCSTFSFL